jgi:hypothetical protein
MLVVETTVNDAAAVPPKLTAVAPVKSVPVIVTVAPCAAVVGVNDTTIGAGVDGGLGSSFLQEDCIKITTPKMPDVIILFMILVFIILLLLFVNLRFLHT